MSELRHRKNVGAGTDRGQDHGSAEVVAENNATEADKADFSKRGMFMLLHKFYAKINKGKVKVSEVGLEVGSVVDEFEKKVAEKSKSKGAARDPDIVQAEVAALNVELRKKYGQDLSIVLQKPKSTEEAADESEFSKKGLFLLLHRFYAKVNHGKMSVSEIGLQAGSVVDEFEKKVVEKSKSKSTARDPDIVQAEVAALNVELRKKYGLDLSVLAEKHSKSAVEQAAASAPKEQNEHRSAEGVQAHASPSDEELDFSKRGLFLKLHKFFAKVNKGKMTVSEVGLEVGSVVDEFEKKVAEKSQSKGAARDPDIVQAEVAALNVELRKKYGQDLSVVAEKQSKSAVGVDDQVDLSKRGMFMLLHKFFAKVNHGKVTVSQVGLKVGSVVDEFEKKVAEKSKSKGAARDPDIVQAEVAALNVELRKKYGQDLSVVMERGSSGPSSRQTDQQVGQLEGGGGGGGMTMEDALVGIGWVLFVVATVGLCLYFIVYGEDGGGDGARARQKQKWGRKVQDVKVSVELTLEELMAGKEGEVRFRRQEVCPHCDGTGAHSRHRCPRCHGKGVEVAHTMMGLMQVECHVCGGHGWVSRQACPVCQGHGVKQAEAAVPYKVRPGMRAGDRVRLEGEGNQAPQADDGDVVVEVKEKRHKEWRREGADLHATIKLSLQEALLGFRRTLRGVDGDDLEIAKEGVTQVGEEVRVRGRGMPAATSRGWTQRRGDAVVTLLVDIPRRLSQRERDAYAAALPS